MAIGISDLPSTILVHHHVPRFMHPVLPFFASQSPVNARCHLRFGCYGTRLCEPPRALVLGDWATFPPQRPGTARFAGRCVSNEQDQKCLSGSVDRSGDNIVSLGTDDRFKSLHRARAQQSDAERKAGPDSWVICPPDIDRGMKAPTPDAGKTPVIPPPGSPGGNPNVQPK